MSPQLHNWVYGRHAHSFAQTYRFGGWRPTVFMQHGLAVGFWMTTASLVGVWLWVSGALKHLWGFTLGWLVPPLLVTTVLCKSAAGIMFLAAGLATLFWIKWYKNALPLYVLILFAPLYMVARTTGSLQRQTLEDLAGTVFAEDRVQSLGVRLYAEDLLSERAMMRPMFGWGRWNPADPSRPLWRVYDDRGKNRAPTDGMWVITMGTTGLFGLTVATLAILLPPILLRRRVPPAFWAHPLAAPAASMAVLLVLHMIDNLLNAMLNPIYVMAIGGICGLGLTSAARAARARGFPVLPMTPPKPQAEGGFVLPAPARVLPVRLPPGKVPQPMTAPAPRVPLPMRGAKVRG
jgi:hypothetical protein